jgi:hypothetical protein
MNPGEVIFNGAKVGHRVSLDAASFSGDGDFSYMQIGAFSARDTHFRNSNRTTSFENIRVSRQFSLEHDSFAGHVNMNGAIANTLELRDVEWVPRRVSCDGMKYEWLNIQNAEHDRLLSWPDLCRYSPALYASFASFLDRNGRYEDASRVRIANQWREGPI